MTELAILATPPRPGLVLPRLSETAPVDPVEAATLYDAAFRDVLLAVEASGGRTIVNYRADEDLPEDHREETSAEAALRAIARATLDDLDDVRFEPQIGSSRAARVGNTITHLLREEGAKDAAMVDPTAPLVTRAAVDSAAMKLRRDEVVLGPAADGGVYFAGFAEPIDFDGAFTTPAVETLTDRAGDLDRSVEFIAPTHRLTTGAGLRSIVPELRARRTAGRPYPPHTAGVIDDLGLRVTDGEEGARLVRDR